MTVTETHVRYFGITGLNTLKDERRSNIFDAGSLGEVVANFNSFGDCHRYCTVISWQAIALGGGDRTLTNDLLPALSSI